MLIANLKASRYIFPHTSISTEKIFLTYFAPFVLLIFTYLLLIQIVQMAGTVSTVCTSVTARTAVRGVTRPPVNVSQDVITAGLGLTVRVSDH